MQGFKFENALRLLVNHFPKETKKPALFHSMRVGAYLWNNNYSEDIQIAGLLHDALEDTDIVESEIEELFGEEVLQIVIANSKNSELDNSIVKEDIVKRCAELSENGRCIG